MSPDIGMTMTLYAGTFFAAGCGWGLWWAERRARRDKASAEIGRLSVSMPTKPDDAALMLGLLSELLRKVEAGEHAA